MSQRRAWAGLAVLSSSVIGLAASVSLASVACSRTPPEPAPLASTSGAGYADKDRPARPSSVPPPVGTGPASSAPAPSAPASSAAASSAPAPSASAGPGASAAGRCITPTPAVAPPIPPPATAAACPPDPEGIPKSTSAQVAFPEAPGNPKVEVEIAKTEHDIQRGLMYRRTMGEEHGMLFHLDERRDHTFWMHNTCISLDMLFVDDDGMVVGIVEGASPLTDTTRSVGCASSWVLEVNAGWCRRHGVRAGQKMGIPPAAR